MPSIDTVLDWKPAALGPVGDSLTGRRQKLIDLQDEMDAAAPPASWRTYSALSATSAHRDLYLRLTDMVAEVSATVTALDTAQTALTRAKSDLQEALTFASLSGFTVNRAGGTVTDTRSVSEDGAGDRQAVCDEIVDRIEQALRNADHADDELAAALRKAASGGVEGGGAALTDASSHGAEGGQRELLEPPDDASDHDYNAWWNGLTTAEQMEVVTHHPTWIGNTDGIPAWARDQANRNLVDDYRSQLEDERDRLQEDVDDNVFDGLFTNDDARLERVKDKLEGLDEIEKTLGLGDRQLLTLDITGEEQLKAAVAVGNVDTADHVAVFTPGLTSTVQDSIGSYDADMRELQKRASAEAEKNGGGFVAAVTWLGYEAPQWSGTLDPDRSVASDQLAQDGAGDLAGFYNGLDAARGSDPHLTALGHSYGSLTTGLALRNQTGVDDAVIFGSPGLGSDQLSDLDVPDGHFFRIEARRDVVADLGQFGIDPSHMDGAVGLSAESSSVDGRRFDESLGHSEYLTNDTTSQYNIAATVAGSPERMVGDGGKGIGDVLSWPVPGTY